MLANCGTPIPLNAAAKLVNPARPPHPSTLHRWANAGVRGIRLQVTRLGGTRYTSAEAVQRFIAALNRDSDDDDADVGATK